jgi:hypothetical protein
VWEYNGPAEETPPERIMVEEPLGPYERKLILLNKGELPPVAQPNPTDGRVAEAAVPQAAPTDGCVAEERGN